MRSGGFDAGGTTRYPSGLLGAFAGDSTSPMAIQVSTLTKRFNGALAVDAVSFSIERGSATALLGPNGAGKTTTLAMLLGLMTPTSGSIRVLGTDMLRHRYRVLGRMNYASPYIDLPQRLTVRENLNVYGRLYGVRALPKRIGPGSSKWGIECW